MVDLRATNAKLRERAVRIVQAVTGVDRDRAEAALQQARLDVKLAILIVGRDLDADEAQLRLTAAQGRLRAALEADR
jgi:N-acetylmuramic acid 6-phosphate etherase